MIQCSSHSPEQVTGHLVFQSIHDYLDELPDDYDTEEIDMWPCWETSDHDREMNSSQNYPTSIKQNVSSQNFQSTRGFPWSTASSS